MKTTPSRRSCLKLAAACTAPAFGSLAFAAPQTKQKFDKVADVIVIGSGFAGLAAALEAKEKGWIRHVGVTSHRVNIAEDCIASGLDAPFRLSSRERAESVRYI